MCRGLYEHTNVWSTHKITGFLCSVSQYAWWLVLLSLHVHFKHVPLCVLLTLLTVREQTTLLTRNEIPNEQWCFRALQLIGFSTIKKCMNETSALKSWHWNASDNIRWQTGPQSKRNLWMSGKNTPKCRTLEINVRSYCHELLKGWHV